MYHVAFFVDHRPFLLAKLHAFLGEELTQVTVFQAGHTVFQAGHEATLFRAGREWPLHSLQSLPPDEYHGYRSFWFLHGPPRVDVQPLRLPPLPLYFGTSLAQMHTWLQWLADHYTWALCPWGGWVSYKSLVFVTAQDTLFTQFIDETGANVWDTADQEPRPIQVVSPQRHNMHIASYRHVHDLAEVCHAVVLQGSEEEGARRLWRACGGSETPPLIVHGAWGRTPDAQKPEFWEEEELTLRGTLDTFVGKVAQYPPWVVLQPHHEAVFLDMCHEARNSFMEVLVVFPGTTSLANMGQLLALTEQEFAYSDLCFFPDALASGEWVYLLGRGHQDDNYGFFVARDNALLHQICGNPEDPSLRVIACF